MDARGVLARGPLVAMRVDAWFLRTEARAARSRGPKPMRGDSADRSQSAAIPPTEANPQRFRRPKPVRSDFADRSQFNGIDPDTGPSAVVGDTMVRHCRTDEPPKRPGLWNPELPVGQPEARPNRPRIGAPR